MTTGTKICDLRLPANLACGAAKCGFYSWKTWTGGDSPVNAVPENVWVKPRYVSYLLPPIDPTLNRLSGASKNRYGKFLIEGHYKTIWKKLPKRAYLSNHSYYAQWVSYYDPAMSWSHPAQGGPFSGTVFSCFGPQADCPNPWSSNDDIALIGKLRMQLVGSDFHAGNFIGEGHQCLRMIGDVTTRVAKSLYHLKRGRVLRASRALFGSNLSEKELLARRASFHLKRGTKPPTVEKLKPGTVLTDIQLDSQWLALQYGWLPLIEDAHGAAEMLAHLLDTPLKMEVRVRRNAGGYGTGKIPIPQYVGKYQLTRPKVHYIRSFKQIIAILREKDVAKLTGLMDPASIAWETLPWSFVVDWFIPIGNWLEARGVVSALEGEFVTTQVFEEYYGSLSPDAVSESGYRTDSRLFYHRRGFMDRSVSNSLSVPLPTLKPLEKALSWGHCVNAVALLSQQRTSRGRP